MLGALDGVTDIVSDVLPPVLPRPVVSIAVKGGLVLIVLGFAKSLLSVSPACSPSDLRVLHPACFKPQLAVGLAHARSNKQLRGNLNCLLLHRCPE